MKHSTSTNPPQGRSGRTRSLTRLSSLGLLLVLGALVPLPARADVPVPGMHGYTRHATVDLGPYADATARWYRVQKGDTLSELAERYLGKTDRWTEITALNPGLTAATLKAETEILLPPRERASSSGSGTADAGEAKPWWDFFTHTMPGGRLQRLDVDGKIPPSPYGGTQLVAVRHDKTAELLEELEHQGATVALLERLEREGKAFFAVSERGLAAHANIEDASPIERQEAAYRVVGIRDGRIELELLFERSYDGQGREVARDARRFTWRDGLLLGLGLVALVLIVWWLRARRARGAETV